MGFVAAFPFSGRVYAARLGAPTTRCVNAAAKRGSSELSLPENSQQHADACGDQKGLDRLFLDIFFQAAFPFLRALPALFVVIVGLIAQLLELLACGIANL